MVWYSGMVRRFAKPNFRVKRYNMERENFKVYTENEKYKYFKNDFTY